MFKKCLSYITSNNQRLGSGLNDLNPRLSLLQMQLGVRSFYLSNSLIIQKPKTMEMHRDVFGYLMKNSSILHP